MTDATWLPNLVGGTSIWKLAVDLNEPKFFDGRLLVPETEGSESLPVTVRWDLTGLLPFAEAQASHPADLAAAVKDFQAALDRVAVVFKTPNSGFDRYKDAFTVPALEGDGQKNYFYWPEKKKLCVINWGASPRSMGGKAEYVFGYEEWARKWKDQGTAVGAPAPVLGGATDVAAATAIAGGVAAAVTAEAKAEEQKPEAEKKKEEKKRPWWIWPLFGLVVIAGILLVLFLLKSCDEPKGPASLDASPDALAALNEAGADANGAADAEADANALAEAGADAAALDAGTDADAGALGDAGKDAGGKDGGLAADDDDDDQGGGGGGGGGGGASSGGGGGGGGTVTVKIGPGGGGKTGAHRKHYMDQAQAWRVTSGNGKVSRTEQSGKRFDVWLAPSQSFEGVRVEWQDAGGKWHVH